MQIQAVELFYSERDTKPLTREEEQVLIRRAQGGCAEAREKIISHNLRFVVKIALSYHQNEGKFEIEDLVSEGNLGLIKALDRFDPDKGYKFISYAVWWIRQSISAYIQEDSGAVRRPANFRQDRRDLDQHMVKLTQTLERRPTEDELALASGLSIHKIRRVLRENVNDYSLDKPMFEGEEESTYGSHILVDYEEADLLAQSLERSSVLEDCMAILDPREQRIIRSHFGLDDGQGLTLQRTAEMMGITRERVRQIRNKALAKMRGYLQRRKMA